MKKLILYLNYYLIKVNYLLFSKILFLILENFSSRNILKQKKKLQFFYSKNNQEKKKIIIKRLQKIIITSYEKNSFYNYFYNLKKVNVYKINKDIKFFEDFPSITKDDILNNQNKIIDQNFKGKIYKNLTGGSTGPSLPVYYDTFANDCSSAITIYCREKHLTYLDSQLHFASNIHGTEQIGKTDKLKSIIFCRFHIFFENFTESKIEEILEQLKIVNPTLVHCHPSVMYQISNYVIEKNLIDSYKKCFKFFETSGEMITDVMIDRILKAFDCKIINRYGLAEFGVVAYQFDTDQKYMNVITSNFYLQKGKIDKIENEKTNFSEIVLTSLTNYFMPLIKYRTGDYAMIDNADIVNTKIYNILGRTHDFVILNNKRIFTHTIQDFIDHKIGNIKDFQIIKDENKLKYKINIVIYNKDYREDTLKKTKEYLKDFEINIIDENKLIRTGYRNKFKRLIL